MKRFVIISTILLLIGVGVFGFSLYHYIDVTRPDSAEATQADSTAQTATESAAPESSSLNDVGVFSANYDKAAADVANMKTEQMVGQLIIGVVTNADSAAADIKTYSLAGVRFKNEFFDYMDKDQITAAVKQVGSAAEISPILAVQEEGGNYCDVSTHAVFSDVEFKLPRSLMDGGDLRTVENAEDEKAQFLKELGFNVNLAPSVDLAAEFNHIMYSRSLSGDVQTTSTYAEYVAKHNQAKGVSVTLKHFPGYGTLPDTYDTIVTDTRDAATIRSTDYAPFMKGAEAGAHFVMMSNVIVQNIDPDHTAALSQTLHRELRENVGFTGLVIADLSGDVDYSDYADGNSPYAAAVLAGNDVILATDYSVAYNAILDAVKDGTISQDILRQACTRMLAYKYTAGLIK